MKWTKDMLEDYRRASPAENVSLSSAGGRPADKEDA